jgi:hypothetical protein
MARACTICARPDAGAINALLAEGRSARGIAVERGISEDALQRHAKAHAARRAEAPRERRAAPEAPATTADPIDELVDALRGEALAGNPAIVHQYRLALQAQAELRNGAAPQRDLATEPEWLALRGRILDALVPYPDARIAVATALGEA